jgi:hypothetical protein
MEQRPLRLGDILDDYCPRERRVTNHVIVAMIDDEIRQTRCSTCETEHPYKGGKAPRRRKPDAAAAAAPAPAIARPPHEERVTDEMIEPHEEAEAVVQADEPAPAEEQPDAPLEEGPVHRPLIRATLPRPEGVKTERPIPEFTIRQNGGRGNGNFRGGFAAKGGGRGGMNGGRPGNVARFGRGPQGRGGQGRGASGGGFNRGPKKRSR